MNVNFGMHGCIHLGTQLPAQVVVKSMIMMINRHDDHDDDDGDEDEQSDYNFYCC